MRAAIGMILGAALVLTSCSAADGTAQQDSTATASQGGAAASSASSAASAATSASGDAAASAASSAAGSGVAVAEANDLFEFSFSYPAAAAAQPALAAWLDGERSKARAALEKQAAEARDEARAGGFDFRAHMLSVEWQQVADLPGHLSLSADIASYGGGAHGNVAFASLLWDKAAAKGRTPIDLFTSAAAFDQAVGVRFCRALNRERAQRRGQAVPANSDSAFDRCISAAQQTLLLGSASGTAFDRMTVQIAPYAAGPYAEGAYSINLPVDAAVVAAVRPDYRGLFRAAR